MTDVRLLQAGSNQQPADENWLAAGGWREDADLVLTFPGNGPATVLGLLATLELEELSGNQG